MCVEGVGNPHGDGQNDKDEEKKEEKACEMLARWFGRGRAQAYPNRALCKIVNTVLMKVKGVVQRSR